MTAVRPVISAPIEIAEIKRDADVDFETEILPLFRRNCLACHSATEAQGDLVLETPQMILKGGGEGPAVVAGKSGESRLLKLASQQKEPLMPPPDNDVKAKPLTPQELGLIKLWIDQGAKGEVKAASSEIAWQPLPLGINPIYAVAITADGQYAAATRANQIFLVQVPSKRELGRLTDPALLSGGIYKQPGVADLDLIQSLKFSPDGTWLASGGFRTVKLWHKTSGRKIVDMSESEAAALAANDSGKFVSPGDKVEEVNVAFGNESKTINHGSAIAASAVSADGKRLVTIGADGSAKLWDVAAGKSIAELKGDLRTSLKAAEQTRAAALAKKHTELAKKDLEDANGRKKAEDENKTKAAEALTKSESDLKPKEEAAKKAGDEKSAADKLLAEMTAAKAKADEGKKAAEEVLVKSDEALKAAKASQEAAAKIETEDGKAAKVAADKATAEIEAVLKLLGSGKQQAAKMAEEAAGKVTESEKKLKDLAAAHQKAIDEEAAAKRNVDTAKRGVERATEAVKKATDAIPGYEALVKAAEEAAKTADDAVAKANAAVKDAEKPVRAAAFSPDGLLVATVGDDGAIHTWDAASGVAVEVFDTNSALTSVAFVDASHVVVTGKSGAAKWNVASEWKLEQTIGSPRNDAVFTDRVTALDFSPDGNTLAVGSGEPSRSGQIKLFDVASGEEKLVIKEPHSDTVNSLSFSPDGKQLASCAADRFVKLWTVADGKPVRSFEGHTHHVLGVAWRPDGRVLVSGGADMVLKIWDARTGDQLRTVQNQFTKEVTSVAFGSDELVLASGGDAKVRAINSTNGNSQRDFSGPSDYMYSVAASADGKTILAGGLDSILRIWNDQGEEIARFAAPPRSLPEKTAAK